LTERGMPAGRAVAGWVAVLVALAGIGLVLTAARSGRTSTISPVTTLSPAPQPSTITLNSAPPEDSSPPPLHRSAPWPVYATYVLLVLVVVALVGHLTWARFSGGRVVRRRTGGYRRPRPLPIPDRPGPERLTEAVDAGLRRLEEGEPTDAVIACWVVLERAAADAGTARRPSETPAQLVDRVLAGHQVSQRALDRLAGLYREARYSRHVLTEADRAEARAALGQVRHELTREVPAW
jgi:Domain of unknown function (DUF4129)